MTKSPVLRQKIRNTATTAKRHPIRTGLVVAILLCVVGVAWIFVAPSKPNLNNVAVIKADVSRHYLLPTNEQPALATVTDTRKLSGAFFKNAKDGDKVLIYQENKIAIIYRPSIDRIVFVGPVSIDTPPSASAQN